MIDKPGFYDLTAAEYHADPVFVPSLSSSIAAEIVTRSPAHALLKHPRLVTAGEETAGEETEAMGFGSVVHALALGKGSEFAVFDGDSWRGSYAIAFKACAKIAKQTPIKRADFTRAKECADALRAQLELYGLGYVLTDGEPEKVAVWQEGEQWCRAMFDRWIQSRNLIVDIKTTGKSAHPEKVARIITDMNYDLRSEFYLRGASKLTGIPARKGGLGYLFIFVETSAPYAVTPCFLDLALATRGRRRANEAIETWARCMERNEWPAYVNTAVEIAAPGWVDFEIEDSEITSSAA